MTCHLKSVLILEDEALIAMDAEACFEAAGHQVAFIARSVSEAMAFLDSEEPDGAILDFNLPDGSSLPIAARLDTNGVPFVFVTSEPREIMRSRGMPSSRIFEKPTDFDIVARRLSEASNDDELALA